MYRYPPWMDRYPPFMQTEVFGRDVRRRPAHLERPFITRRSRTWQCGSMPLLAAQASESAALAARCEADSLT